MVRKGNLAGENGAPEGFEPPTFCLEGRCSIRLSYGRYAFNFSYCKRLRYFLFFIE